MQFIGHVSSILWNRHRCLDSFIKCCGFIVVYGSLYWFRESVECWIKVGFRTMSLKFL